MKSSAFDGQALDQKLTYHDVESDLMTIGKAYLDEIYASLPPDPCLYWGRIEF